ncbi:hypothetical protein CCY99_04920 [Helicobacter sp. 16-1353]|uniref:HP0495 family protein n=1 Tax=Helicobacter sp. 16-1353 TaxID=2004996 RepID=UPI000DCD7B78|nr:DUF493 domain-containing protein [Helicobacter sp. 16-1353]RAX54026.1 hypothetical protein CCY99_04920 [Helicobacter sp. 16-1353]
MQNVKDSKIEYPTLWEYLIITNNKETLEFAIKEKFEMLDYTLNPSKESKNGRYASFTFTIQVISQKERDDIFKILTKIEDVKFVV